MMKRVLLGWFALCLCVLAVETHAEALDSRVRYRLRKINRSLSMAKQYLKRGRISMAKRLMRGVDRNWARLWCYYKDRISMQDPEIAQAHKEIQSIKKQLNAPPPQAAPPQRTGGRDRGVPSFVRRGDAPQGNNTNTQRPRRGRNTRRPYGVPVRRTAAPSGGASLQVCYGKPVLDACSQLSSKAYKICRFDHGALLPSWHKKLNQIPAVAREVRRFLKKHQGCLSYTRRVHIKVPGSYTRTKPRWKRACDVVEYKGKCEAVLARFKTHWAKKVASLSKNGSAKELRLALKYNKNPQLQADASALQARLSGMVRAGKRAKARANARLASRRCPSATHPNPALKRAVRWAIMSIQKKPKCRGYARASARRRCLSSRMYVRSYHLMSRPTRPRYHTWRRFYSQTVRVDACVRRKFDGRTQCRVYHYLLKRIKPLNGRWGPWRRRSFSFTNMLCKHLP